MPVVYTTAYYSLVVRGRMQRGETVLIHSGSGGVGQAAISIALSLGCRVFTTVGKGPAPRTPDLELCDPGSPGPLSSQAQLRSEPTSRPGSLSSMTPALLIHETHHSSSMCYCTPEAKVGAHLGHCQGVVRAFRLAL